jgi:hypothetical protein
VQAALQQDLALLKKLAFRRVDACGDLLARFHRLSKRACSHAAYVGLQRVRQWLLSPLTLWPVDFAGLASHLLNVVENYKRTDAETVALLSFIAEHPSTSEQCAVRDLEHQVQAGNYTSLVTAQPKFANKQEMLFENAAFQTDWQRLKAEFDVNKWRDRKGIIRRRMAQERSFRPEGWSFRWRTREQRFRIVFDAFCHKWVLYGMEGERPLLQMLSVNVTPFGTMIFVPRYWSFDAGRDMKWGAVAKLHRARDVHRQGEKLGQNQRERLRDATRVQKFWREAKQSGRKGASAYDWVIKKMGWPSTTDASKVKRLLQENP